MTRLAAALALLLLWPTVGASAFRPPDPLAARQWYLAADHAFDAWAAPPALDEVKVAVIDSGIDLGHPEFENRVAAARSFVGGSVVDHEGHGTFVAGEIAAALGNGEGIAGIAFPARLVVAKVLHEDGQIDPAEEARAIRWAVAQGARVINLSFGGTRNPLDPRLDEFSPPEAAAVREAVRAGVVVVAAVGNSPRSEERPWPYADYPAALPHVLGVGAYARSGAVPAFSNRDLRFVDLVAPGSEMISTVPLALSGGCDDSGYSDCGPFELRSAYGTSFAAPQAAAGAALLLALRPWLRPEQVTAILERSARDDARGGRNGVRGWGRLDIGGAIAALAKHLPPADSSEPNDDFGIAAPLSRRVRATLDYWDDPLDVYRFRLTGGHWAAVRLTGLRQGAFTLWYGRRRLLGPARRRLFRAGGTGTYFVRVFARSPAAGRYTLRLATS